MPISFSYSALPDGTTILDDVCVIFIGAAFTNTQIFALSSSKHLVALRVVWFRLKILKTSQMRSKSALANTR